MANSASSNELHSITKHNNIVIGGVQANEVLKFDGSNWINQTLVEAGIAPVATPTFTTSITIGSATISEAELEILDGATVTTTELNLVDGGTTRGTTAVASGDGILINDAGTMRMTNVDTVSTYFSAHNVGGSNLVTVGTIGTGVWNGTAIVQGYIGGEAINESKMQVSNSPTNGHVLTARDGVTGGFTWEAAAASGANTALSNLASVSVNADINMNTNAIENINNAYSDLLEGAWVTSAASSILSINSYAANAGGSALYLSHSRHGTLGTLTTAMVSGDELGTIEFRGSNGSSFRTEKQQRIGAPPGLPRKVQ